MCCLLLNHSIFFIYELPTDFCAKKRHIVNFFWPALALEITIQHKQHWGFSSATNVPICGATIRVALNEAQRLTVVNNVIGDQWIITVNCSAVPLCMHFTTHISCPFCVHTQCFTIQKQKQKYLLILRTTIIYPSPLWPVRRHSGLVRNWATVVRGSGGWNCVAPIWWEEAAICCQVPEVFSWSKSNLLTCCLSATSSPPCPTLNAGSIVVIHRSGI